MLDRQMGKTVWPSYIAGLEPDLSESTLAALVPSDVTVQVPDSNVPPDKARWSGAWSGWACQARLCDIKLIVEKVTDQGATIAYARASAALGRFSERLAAKFNADELQGTLANGYRLAFRMRKDGVLEFLLRAGNGQYVGGVLSQDAVAPERLVERIPTTFLENGTPVTLEVVIFKPPGPGPFPTVMFNHGSTGNGDNPSSFTSTWTTPGLAKFFTERGWLVASCRSAILGFPARCKYRAHADKRTLPRWDSLCSLCRYTTATFQWRHKFCWRLGFWRLQRLGAHQHDKFHARCFIP